MQKIIYNNTLKRVSVYIFIFLTIIHLLVISKQALKNSKLISRRKTAKTRSLLEYMSSFRCECNAEVGVFLLTHMHLVFIMHCSQKESN
jgi:hypothetical protein